MQFTITINEVNTGLFEAIWVSACESVSGSRSGFPSAADAEVAAKAWVDNWNASLTATPEVTQVDQITWGG